MEVYRYNNKIPLPLIKNDQNTLENMEENLMEHNLRVCLHCLMGIESREGKQFTKEIWIDPDDSENSMCEWCEETGFDTLYELI